MYILGRIKFYSIFLNLESWKKSSYKPVNKGLPREEQHMTFIDKWPLFGGYIVIFNQRKVTELWPLFTGWSLFRGGL